MADNLLKVLIIDDGSTDQTSKICKSYQDNDSRIKLFRNETNIGFDTNGLYNT